MDEQNLQNLIEKISIMIKNFMELPEDENNYFEISSVKDSNKSYLNFTFWHHKKIEVGSFYQQLCDSYCFKPFYRNLKISGYIDNENGTGCSSKSFLKGELIKNIKVCSIDILTDKKYHLTDEPYRGIFDFILPITIESDLINEKVKSKINHFIEDKIEDCSKTLEIFE